MQPISNRLSKAIYKCNKDSKPFKAGYYYITTLMTDSQAFLHETDEEGKHVRQTATVISIHRLLECLEYKTLQKI